MRSMRRVLQQPDYLAFALAAAAVVLALACSRYGASIGGDGVGYVMASRNLLAGYGLSWVGAAGDIRPMTIFGPLFPLLLSALGLLGIDALVGARVLNAFLFGVNAGMVYVLLRGSSRARGIAVLGMLLFVFFPPVLGLHTGVQSEPIFLMLLLLETLALTRVLQMSSRGWLLVAAIAAGLGYLARYAGLAFIASGALAGLTWPKHPWRQRIRQVILFVAVAAIPVAYWMARNAAVGGSATERVLDFEPLAKSLIVLIADLVTYWFLPDRVPLAIRTLILLLGIGCLTAAWLLTRRADHVVGGGANRDPGPWALERIAAWGVAVYAGQVLISRVFLLPRISLDQRILAPVWLLSTLLLLEVVDGLYQRSRPAVAKLAAAMLILWTGFYLVRGTIRALELQVDGVGFASRAWRTSPLINAMSLLPGDTPVYTNEVEGVYLLAGRRVYRLPTGCLPFDALVVFEPGTECRTPEYLTWVANMDRALERDRAVLAVFNTYRDFPYYSSLVPEMVEGLDVLTSQGDGKLYVYDRDEWPDNPNW
jgi:hypothetical protein